MIELQNVSKAYGDNRVLTDFSARIPDGQTAAIMALSGSGKTTLLRLILGLEQPDSGSITGVPKKCAAVFQEDRLCPGMTVTGNIRAAAGKAADSQRTAEILKKLGLEEASQLPAEQLSGGMARRTALARALLAESDLLVLDEPFNGLDEENRRNAAAVIREYAAGKTILLVTHREEDMQLLAAVPLEAGL